MSILVVDDCSDTRTTLRMLLESRGYSDIRGAGSGEEALTLLGTEYPSDFAVTVDVILMDVGMPVMDGIETCRRIKAIPHLRDIPVLIITGDAEERTLETAFAAGACDYLTKPVHPAELLARVRSALNLKREFDRCKTRADELARLSKQLQQLNAELQRLAVMDELTGVANRRFFNHRLAEEWGRAVRAEQPLSLILLDVDYFKNYNDHYGHQQGDHCLKEVAAALSHAVRRTTDLVARYGGEEFVVLMPNTDQAGAVAVAEGLRRQVDELGLAHAKSPVYGRVTISLGVATMVPTRDCRADRLLSAADRAVYESKHAGRNRVSVSDGHLVGA